MNVQEIAGQAGLVVIEVDGAGVKQPRMVTAKATGAQMQMPGSQSAFVWQGQKYPVPFEVEWDPAKGPHRPGFYFLGGPIFASGDYGRLQLKGTRDLVLVPAEEVLDRLAVAGGSKKAA